jgi:acetyltransferase-like isoleucine patch superfamily enzyme
MLNQEKVGNLGKSPITIGRYSYGIENITVREWGEGKSLNIGAFCSISSDVLIFLGGNHRVDWISTFPFGHIFQDELGAELFEGHPSSNGNVVIGNDVWIGHGVTIVSGVSIGDGAVIRANSHVVKDVPAYHMAGGNPTSLLRPRFAKSIINFLLQLSWWELPIEEIIKIKSILCNVPSEDNLISLLNTYPR